MNSISENEMLARYQLACEIAKQGAEIAFDYYQRRDNLFIEHKGNDLQDVVSIADRAVEEIIRKLINDRFPQDGFFGEESGATTTSADCVWVVDPIDGTSCFLNGLHTWCVSIGVIIHGEPVIGAIYDPNHKELFHACKGFGAFLNQQSIKVHSGKTLKDGVMGVGTSHRVTPEEFVPFISQLLHAGGMFIRSGSGALMTAQVAAGRLIAYYEPHMNAWDSLPGIALVNEAGGLTNNFLIHDGLHRGNVVLMSNPEVYPQLVKMVTQKIY